LDWKSVLAKKSPRRDFLQLEWKIDGGGAAEREFVQPIRVWYTSWMIDLEMDRRYAEGALNTYIAELSAWIGEKEAAIEKNKHKTFLAPILRSLQKHIDETRPLFSEAENFHAQKQTSASDHKGK
jgi:hypothetical protein